MSNAIKDQLENLLSSSATTASAGPPPLSKETLDAHAFTVIGGFSSGFTESPWFSSFYQNGAFIKMTVPK